MEGRLTSHELSEWIAYARVEPFGQTRDNWHMATLASLIYAVNRGEDSKELGPQDFMWQVEPTEAEQRRQERIKARGLWRRIVGGLTGNKNNGNLTR